jgi:eukaryotic translation initiation factor 2C
LAEKTPKVTFIVGTKRHSKRFFRIDQDGISNTKAGDVVNGGVTRQDIQEFFLQSHHPIQGTAQLTQYDILKDDLKIGRENLEEFMLLLANMHQLCGYKLFTPIIFT